MSTDQAAQKKEKPSRRWFTRLPSWRSWVAILIGLAVGIGAFALSSQESRTGIRTGQITIDDPGEYLHEEELAAAIETVAWGRPIRVLVVVQPLSALSVGGQCEWHGANCLQANYPSYFPSAAPADDAAVLWIDPERGTASMVMGTLPRQEPADFYSVEFGLGDVLTLRIAEDELTAQSISDAFQILADAESQVTRGITTSNYILAFIAGGVAAILVDLALNAAKQRADQRRGAAPLAHLSTRERRRVVDRVFETYREATGSLDEIELIGVIPAGSYRSTLSSRIAQYQRRYVELARAVFEVQHLDRDDLARPSHMTELYRLDRLATIVREAGITLRADESLLQQANGTSPSTADFRSHPSVQHVKDALRALSELAGTTGDKALLDRIPKLTGDLERVTHSAPRSALTRLDSLASTLATTADHVFVSYVSEHGREFADRTAIEDPFRFRTLEETDSHGTPTDTRYSRSGRGRKNRKKRANERHKKSQRSLTEAQVKQSLEENLAAAKVGQGRDALKIPVSPLIIMVAAALAIGAGAGYVWLNPVEEGVISEGENIALTIPDSIVENANQQKNALTVPGGDDFDDLVTAESVTIVDEAGIVKDAAALEDALSTIPLPGPAHVVILTSEEKLPETEYGTIDDLGLIHIFPDYYESLQDEYSSVIPDQSIILWFTDSGKQVGYDMSYDTRRELDPEYVGTSGIYGVLRNSYPSVETQSWDVLVGFSNATRGVHSAPSEATVSSGSSNVTEAVILSVITFLALVILLPIILKPVVLARRRKRWSQELTSTMTAMTLAHEALHLEIMMVAEQFSTYDSEPRFLQWDKDYLEAQRLTVNATDIDLPLETQVAVIRTVREQAESLWRIRPILEQHPTWNQAWENDSTALYAALGPDGATTVDQITTLTTKLVSGALTPVQALTKLDTLARGHEETARLRSLEHASTPEVTDSESEPTRAEELAIVINARRRGGSDSSLVKHAVQLAETPVFALVARDDIDAGNIGVPAITAGQSVQDIPQAQLAAQTFFSLDTSAARWLQAVLTSVRGSTSGAHKESPAQLTKTAFLYGGVIVLGFIGLAILNAIVSPDMSRSVREVEQSDPPISVVTAEKAGPISAELVDAFSSAELGMPVHVLLYTNPGECTYSSIDNLVDVADDYPHILRASTDWAHLRDSVVAFCIGDNSLDVSSASNVNETEELRDMAWEYRYSADERVDPQEWLLEWLNNPGREPAFSQRISVRNYYDDNIR